MTAQTMEIALSGTQYADSYMNALQYIRQRNIEARDKGIGTLDNHLRDVVGVTDLLANQLYDRRRTGEEFWGSTDSDALECHVDAEYLFAAILINNSEFHTKGINHNLHEQLKFRANELKEREHLEGDVWKAAQEDYITNGLRAISIHLEHKQRRQS